MKRMRMEMRRPLAAAAGRVLLALAACGFTTALQAQDSGSLDYHTRGRTPFAERAPGWWLNSADRAAEPVRTAAHAPVQQLPEPARFEEATLPAAPLPGTEFEGQLTSFNRSANCGCAAPAPSCCTAPSCAAAPSCHAAPSCAAPAACGCHAAPSCGCAARSCGCAAKSCCGCKAKKSCGCERKACCSTQVTCGSHSGCSSYAAPNCTSGCTAQGVSYGGCANGRCSLGNSADPNRILSEKVIGEKVIRERRLDDNHLPPPPIPSND